ncbi:cell division protein FtsQ/DivIB [Aeromicrobium yanjiei]|uniref:FtsQ-type POTRA domain-containing protein n=1 Tax=Aeromicrobium yanjiei TaxID=2662028 RepID=A0A5Q2ML68_9ACTN|nr:FtsQ-type POTRA domain-containing protein [Aeromicrobium yanjiei]QGG41115.1 FtsQ-type POTRA domain-containing protein [Aeromicrobium yanjiei]
MTDPRFVDRARQDRRRKIKRIALAVLAVVVAAAVVWTIWFSSLLAVHDVKVAGQATYKPAKILRVADVPAGRPLARVDLAAIESRIAGLERIESVDVSRSWPRTISIDVVERKAIIWATVSGRIRGIDKEGIDFRSYGSEPSQLVEATITVTDPAQRLETTRSVATVVDRIGREDPSLRRQLQSVSAASKDSIELDLTRGRTVVWGSDAKGARKLEVLRSLLDLDATRYDVSAPDQPTTRQ